MAEFRARVETEERLLSEDHYRNGPNPCIFMTFNPLAHDLHRPVRPAPAQPRPALTPATLAALERGSGGASTVHCIAIGISTSPHPFAVISLCHMLSAAQAEP